MPSQILKTEIKKASFSHYWRFQSHTKNSTQLPPCFNACRHMSNSHSDGEALSFCYKTNSKEEKKCRTKGSVQFRGLVKCYGELSASSLKPSWRINPCRLFATAYSICSQLRTISRGVFSIRNLMKRHVVVTEQQK